MSDPTVDVEEDGAVVRFRRVDVEVVVDARDHDLLLRFAGGRAFRLAASRAGLADAALSVEEALAVDGASSATFTHEVVAGHLKRALVAAARVRGVDVEPACVAVGAILETVLPCCRAIVDNPYLLADIARFRAAAAAVAFLEDRTVHDRTVPEQTDAWAHRLRDWRSLYVAKDSVARSVNRTLTVFGEEVAPELLWGLQRVVITAPLPSVQHVEVLGGLGALTESTGPVGHDRMVDRQLQEIVLRASAQQLGEALVLVDEADHALFGSDVAALRLAEVLTSVPIEQLREIQRRRVSFSDLLEHALHELREVLQIDTETIAPPIPLPSSPDIRFLGTVGAILREGVDMNHCVATRAPRALAGDSYLFHIEHEGERATAELSRAGAVLEVRGPSNGRNGAVVWATSELRLWGAQLVLQQLGGPSTSLWSTPSPPVPDGCEPLKTLGELQAALSALTTPHEVGDDSVWVWAAHCAEEAVAGRRWLVVLRAAGVTLLLSSLDERGEIKGNAIAVREAARAISMVDEDDDDDDRWEDRT